jgi:hypothetical protein
MKTKTNEFQELLERSGIEQELPIQEQIRRKYNLGVPPKQPTPKRFNIEPAQDKSERDVVYILDKFLNTDSTKERYNHYFVDGPELLYRTVCTNNGQQQLEENTIAIKIKQPDKTHYLGNSSALGLIGRSNHWGTERLNSTETDIQRKLSLLITMVPFSVFEQANLDLQSYRLVDRGPEETVTRRVPDGHDKKTGKPKFKDETVHFTGASLFTVGDNLYLFDIDRREISLKVFNPFLVQIPVKVKTIAEAYEALKPQQVKDAEQKGIQVRRQGEFFFVPVDKSEVKRLDAHKDKLQDIELRAGDNRPNNAKGVQFLDGEFTDASNLDWHAQYKLRDKIRENRDKVETFVTSKVEHSGREHAPLILKGWYRAYANTAMNSFTIEGDID